MEKDKKTFESAAKELESIIERMEKGEMTLEESVKCFKKGMELSLYCSRKLDEAERKITVLLEDKKGEIKEMDFDPDDESVSDSDD